MTKNEIIDMYLSGVTVSDIANLPNVDVSRATIYKYLKLKPEKKATSFNKTKKRYFKIAEKLKNNKLAYCLLTPKEKEIIDGLFENGGNLTILDLGLTSIQLRARFQIILNKINSVDD